MNGERKEKPNVQQVINNMFSKSKETKKKPKTEKELFVMRTDKKKKKKS